ncbi:MAG: hypothetical protein FJX02_02135 [Alphaproteobacteria bacterium]|nr:hypothetical protein [Alphaproteobacteria bacterium]
MRALARVAIERQFARPALARALDFEEARLALDEDDRRTTARIGVDVGGLLAPALALARLPANEAVADIVAIARALIDEAARRGESDTAALERRVCRAVLGYIAGPR